MVNLGCIGASSDCIGESLDCIGANLACIEGNLACILDCLVSISVTMVNRLAKKGYILVKRDCR